MGSLIVPAILVAVAFGCAAWALLGHFDEKVAARDSLRLLDEYEPEELRKQMEPSSASDRLVKPLVAWASDACRKIVPVSYSDRTRRKLVHLGRGTSAEIDRFMAVQGALMVAGIGVALWTLFGPLPLTGPVRYVLGFTVAASLFLMPNARLDEAISDRKREMQRSLPDIMDLLTISVEAGLGFEQALDRVVMAVPGPLSEEFVRLIGEIRAGATRADAFRALDERCDMDEIKMFTMAIIQADTYGISVGQVLRSQADEIRIRRRQRAQEVAQKTPVKMLVPIALCIFPSLLVVILVPAGINILAGMG